jgi:hypothetical protein
VRGIPLLFAASLVSLIVSCDPSEPRSLPTTPIAPVMQPYALLPGTAASRLAARTTVLHVNMNSSPNGDGSGGAPFHNLGDAITRANAIGGALIIVAPGRYGVSATMQIESPITIRGANVMVVDADGLPTGVVEPGTETRIAATSALGSNTMLVVGRNDATVLNDVSISNVTIQGASLTGLSLLILRTQGFAVRDNILIGPALFAIATAASSGGDPWELRQGRFLRRVHRRRECQLTSGRRSEGQSHAGEPEWRCPAGRQRHRRSRNCRRTGRDSGRE